MQIPRKCDPWQAADRNRLFEFKLDSSALKRVDLATKKDITQLDVVVEFLRENKKALVKIKLTGELILECQRCLKPIHHSLKTSNVLAIVQGDQEAKVLAEIYDPLLINEEGLVELHELVEDEILLSLPQIAIHPEGDCQLVTEDKIPIAEKTEPIIERENPFLILKQLKK